MSDNLTEKTDDEKSTLGKIAERVISNSYIQGLRSLLSREKKIGVVVDGPNFLRKVNNRQIKLDDLESLIKEEGKITIKKVILNEFANESFIQAVTNSGYEAIVTPHDVYIQMSITVMEMIQKKIDVIVIGTRHARAVPLVQKVKERGVEVFIVAYEPGLSVALKKSADKLFMINL